MPCQAAAQAPSCGVQRPEGSCRIQESQTGRSTCLCCVASAGAFPVLTPLPYNLCRQSRQHPHLLKQLQQWTSQSIRRTPL